METNKLKQMEEAWNDVEVREMLMNLARAYKTHLKNAVKTANIKFIIKGKKTLINLEEWINFVETKEKEQ